MVQCLHAVGVEGVHVAGGQDPELVLRSLMGGKCPCVVVYV